ncbi:hypothetical protein HYDPIDRAFT_107672 [Hydnomerulius pinastri MD-312]|nr:hypothetical protein HYDPIDRAFT_107672 [Hydnomerulius pinastri MD-312]
MIRCHHENGGRAYLARLWVFVTLGVCFKRTSAWTCLANNDGISSKLFERRRSSSRRELLMHLRSTSNQLVLTAESRGSCTARHCSRGRRYMAPVVGRAHVDIYVQGPSMT